MKTTDLMLGDWVLRVDFKTPVPSKIIGIEVVNYDKMEYVVDVLNKNGHNVQLYLNEIEPIPLTPEILEKNGFVLKSDGWLWCKEEGINEQNYIFIQFRKGCDEIRLVELNFVNKVLAKYEQIQYVHELQHALKLCHTKKEIVL